MKTEIIIISCDKFADIWPITLKTIDWYWPLKNNPIYFISNKKTIKHPRVINIQTSKDLGYCKNLLYTIDKLSNPETILFIQEDYILRDIVNQKFLDEIDQFIRKYNNIACIRLVPTPGPDKPYPNWSKVGLINKNADYLVSTAPAIWKTNVLKQILMQCDTPWDFEKKGTQLARIYLTAYDFLSVWRSNSKISPSPVFPVWYTAIIRGNWWDEFLNWANEKKIEIDTTQRGVADKSFHSVNI